MNDIESKVVEICLALKEELSEKLIRESQDLLEDGFIDSLGLIEIIDGIEQYTNSKISLDSVSISDFKDINSIVQIVEKHSNHEI